MSVSWQGPSGDALDRLMRDGILEHMRKALGSVRVSESPSGTHGARAWPVAGGSLLGH